MCTAHGRHNCNDPDCAAIEGAITRMWYELRDVYGIVINSTKISQTHIPGGETILSAHIPCRNVAVTTTIPTPTRTIGTLELTIAAGRIMYGLTQK